MIEVTYLKTGTVSPFGFGNTVNCVKGECCSLDDATAIALRDIGWAKFAPQKETKVSAPTETKVSAPTETKEEKPAHKKRGPRPKAK